MPPKEKYTDPKLRDEVKEEIHQGDKGGAPGQWSARKAQMMASEYKKRGGDYNTDKKDQDESQKHLSKWGEEDWQTKEGSGNAKQEDGSEKRYLPKKAWEKMSEREKKETEEKKLEGGKKGKQHVGNTGKAKESREEAQEEGEEEEDGDEEYQEEGEGEDKDDENEESGDKEQDGEEDQDNSDDDEEERDNEKEGSKGKDTDKPGQKRARSSSSSSPAKKQKSNSGESKETNGKTNGKSDSPPGPAGSADRLPEKGQKVQWHSLPGYVSGEVVEVVYEEKTVEGKKVKGAEGDPRIVLKSESSGKIAVHKPEAVYFE